MHGDIDDIVNNTVNDHKGKLLLRLNVGDEVTYALIGVFMDMIYLACLIIQQILLQIFCGTFRFYIYLKKMLSLWFLASL